MKLTDEILDDETETWRKYDDSRSARMAVARICFAGPRRRMAGHVVTLGLPADIKGCLFDLDGVLTQTARLHAKAWKQTFDEVLRARATTMSNPVAEFELADYTEYVDGKPREDGVRDFLASRGIHLREGVREDSGDCETIFGVGNRKNDLVKHLINVEGVEVFSGSRRYLRAAMTVGMGRVVVSSSANTACVLRVSGLAELIEARIDGVTLVERNLAGKPAPDSFLAGAELLGLPPAHCAVFEDALSGVRAGHDAGCFVIGVDRVRDGRHGLNLRHSGADMVIADLDDLLTDEIDVEELR